MENSENKGTSSSSKNYLLWALIVVVLVVLVIVVVASGGRDDSMSTKQEGSMVSDEKSMMMQEEDKMMEQEGMMDSQSGSYQMYSEEKLALAQEGEVVLFFKASWCPTCRALDSDIRDNLSSIPEGVHILEVDYDEYTELRQKYGVTYQHTLVQVDQEGNQVAKWSGSPTLSALLEEIE